MTYRMLVERSFEVGVGLEEVWAQLARVGEWPAWARHIRKVVHQPAGPLGPGSSGRIHLRGGARSTFRMAAFNPYRNWTWVGPFLWLRVRYDHRFQPLGTDRTRLTWTVEGDGAGVAVLGRVFGTLYARNLDKAIPRLEDKRGPDYRRLVLELWEACNRRVPATAWFLGVTAQSARETVNRARADQPDAPARPRRPRHPTVGAWGATSRPSAADS